MSHLHLQLPVAAPRISAAYTGLRIDGILRRHRQILLEILLLIAALLFNQGTPAAERQTFRFADINEKALELWEGAQPVLVYNYGVITNSTLTDAAPHSCYVHPLYGLDGEVLTGDFP